MSISIVHLNAGGRATFTPTGNFNHPGQFYDTINCNKNFTTYYSNTTNLCALEVDIFFQCKSKGKNDMLPKLDIKLELDISKGWI